MKTKLLLSILIIFSYFGLQAQNNYLVAGSIPGLTIQLNGNSGLTGQSKQAQSYATSTEALWFVAPSGYDNTGTPRQYGNLTAYLRNTSNAWIKITLYQGNSSNKIKQLSIPPLFQIDEVDFCNASDNFYWKVEANTPQTPLAIADTIVAVRLYSSAIINVLQNDENLGNNYSARVKPGQTLFGMNLSNIISRNGDMSVYLPTNATNTSFKYQILDPADAVLTEGDVYIKVIEQPQYCLLNIVSLQLAAGSKDQYILITGSPNSSITGPFNYTIKNVSTNAIVRSGQTPNPDVIYKTISFLNLPTATYEVKVSAIGKSCSATETIYHIATNDACNIKVNYISKKGTTNTYEADVSFSEITTYKWESNYGTNVGLGGNNGNKVSFTLPTNTPEGDYTFIVRNEGAKQCSFASFFNHRNLQANTGALETYVKMITGKPDNWEIRGLNSEASGRDYTTQWRIADNKPNIIWQSYISDWQNLGQSASALASIGFQKDTARNEPGIWLSVFENRTELRQRNAKSGSVTTVNTAYGVTFPLWVRLEKIGSSIVAKYSATQSMFPVWTQLGIINNTAPASTWAKLVKTLSVGSGKSDVTSSARFQGHLGGIVNFGNTSTQTPTAPSIIKSIVNPNQNDALTLSASNCSNGSIVKWYKNNVSAGAGSTLAIIAIHNDAYYARCENGSIRSDSSNVIRFNYITNSCDNATAFSISTITATTGNNFAVAYNASSSLTSVNVDIKNASNSSVRNYDTPVTANPLLIDAGVLTTGTYTLKLTGKSCTGNASKSFTINAASPTLSCNNNGTFSISSISQSDGQLYNVTYNASNLSNVEAVVKNASNIAVRTITLSVNSNPTVVDIGNQAAGTYTLQLNGLSCLGSTTTKTFTVVDNKSSCNNGGSFSIASATYNAGSLTFEFNAANLGNATWTVRQGSTIISSGILADISSRTNTVNTTTLAAGTYSLQLEGNSCIGLAVRQFSVGTVTTTPTLASSIPSPVTGDNITLTATGCTGGNYNFYKNLETNPFATNTGTAQISNVQGPDYYYVQCASGSLNSNYITVGSVGGTGTGTGQTSFINITKTVPVEIQNGKYSPQFFRLAANNAIPRSVDPVLGKPYPHWAVAWQAEGGNFSRNNTTTVDVGMSFMYDRNPVSYAGYGERCLDFIYETNPNTGTPWASDIDPNCKTTWMAFTSRIPFYERAFSQYGQASESEKNTWINSSAEAAFDRGTESIQARSYGQGDKVNGKVNIGLSNADIEIGLEQGFQYYPRHLAFLMGMGKSSQGYVFSQYSAAINGVGADLSYYPNDLGVFPALKKKLDGTNYINGNGGTDVNNIPLSPDWDPNSKITLTGKGVTNQGVIDYTNVLPCIEISSTSDMTYRHGETYARKNGWAYTNGELSYSSSNPIDNTVVDKFGMNRNTNHIIADVICYGDVNKWWSVNKLNGRKVVLQSKITCDRANLGVFNEAGFTNQSLRFKHYDREYGFDIGGFTALTGCEWQIWDRNTQENLDGYHGALGVVNLMNQKKSFGSSSVSFADLKPRLNFLLWNSEVSYDNGLNYFKDKATEYILSENKLPQRQAISSDGYWIIFAARPEGIEPTTAKFRISYNGITYYHTITSNDWETVDYAQRNVALSSLPLSNKDYYYTIIKLGDNGGTSENTTVTTPTITSTPTNPTAGVSTTFTASNCAGTIKWYSSDAQVGTGSSYTITNPEINSVFMATCTVGSITSPASNTITVAAAPSSGSITITEPAIIATQPYYFTNGQAKSYYLNTDGSFTNNLPVIYRSNTRSVSNYSQPTARAVHPTIKMESGYSMTEDIVWMQNNLVKFGINIKRGGQLAWASRVNETSNLVYNGYDGGFQVTLDAYQKKDGYSQNGKYSRKSHSDIYQFNNTPRRDPVTGVENTSIPDLTSYNTTQGGDFVNNSVSLLYHYRDGNSYVVAVRPIFYTIDSEISQVIIETKYTLEPDAIGLRIEYKYISKRTDGQYDGGGFDAAAAPACFLVNTLSKYKVHDGDNLISGNLPVENYGQATLGVHTNKKYLCVHNDNDTKALGVYRVVSGNSAYCKLKQLEVNGSAGTEFTGGFTYVDFNEEFASPVTGISNRNNYERTMISYIMVGNNSTEIATEANRLKILLGN